MRDIKYSCLVFDHDDTVVNSTATLHYPSFIEYLKIYRPGMSCTLRDYFIKNFDPGFVPMCVGDYHMSGEDLETETEFWKNYVKGRIPEAYPGIKEIMERQKAGGGKTAVISHSFRENILRDYRANGLPEPDLIYGWEQPPERRKPSVWPLEDIMEKFGLAPSELLVIDDLKPGYNMAKDAGVPFAAAGWAYDIPEIEGFMRKNCGLYFKTVEELGKFLT